MNESLSDIAAFAAPSFAWSDLKGENRRFMFDGRRMLIGMKGGSPTEGSHSTEWRDATGGNAGFDDAVRGWVGIGGRAKNGVIHFSPPIESDMGAYFDKGWDCLEWFKKRGATGKTLVRGFPGKWEQTLDDAMSGALAESRLSQVEFQVARLKGADAEKVRDMLAAGIASTRVAKDMPRPSGSWAWFEVFDVRDGINAPGIPGVAIYAPVKLTPSQFGSAAKKALMRAVSESAATDEADLYVDPRPQDLRKRRWSSARAWLTEKSLYVFSINTLHRRMMNKPGITAPAIPLVVFVDSKSAYISGDWANLPMMKGYFTSSDQLIETVRKHPSIKRLGIQTVDLSTGPESMTAMLTEKRMSDTVQRIDRVLNTLTEKNVNLAVGRGEKLPVSKGAGLTAKGRAKYNRETGSKLKAPTKDKDNPRHKSFCARSRSWSGERGKAARKRWGC